MLFWFSDLLITRLIQYFDSKDSGFSAHSIPVYYNLHLQGTRLWEFALKDSVAHFMMSPESYDPAAAEDDSVNTIYGDAELSTIFVNEIKNIAFCHGRGQKIVQINASFMKDT